MKSYIDKRKTGTNNYPKGGVSCFADSFGVAQSSVLRMNFSGKNPALRVAAKRYNKRGLCCELIKRLG